MDQPYLVRHWQGQDSIERVVTQRLLLADNVVEALLKVVPIDDVEQWRLDTHVEEYASLTNPKVDLLTADYWEAERVEDPLTLLSSMLGPTLN